VAEFFGTGVLALVVLAVQRSSVGFPLFVAIAAGLVVGALSYVFAGASGAYFNPAITLGAWSVRKIRAAQALSYMVVQLLGGWAAYGVYTYFVNTSLPSIGGHFTLRTMIAEGVGAMIFAFVWAAVSAQRLAASVVGVGLSLGVIVAGIAAYGYVNPGVALAARAWVVSDFTHWTGWLAYGLGPVVGGVVGFWVYQLVFGESMWLSSAAATATSRTLPKAVPAARATTARSTRGGAKKAPATRRKK